LSTDSSEILSEASSNALPFIPGVDVKRGIAMTGGTTGGYRQVLAMFRKDAEERLRLLRETPGSEALPSFITQVHALKSAAASLGAAEVSAEAARLEAAGKNGDTVFIAESLPGFAERLEELVKGIRAVLNENAAAVEQSGRTEDGALLPLLNELAETLKAQKADAIDRVLEELARRPLDAETREALEHISDQALLAEFGAALETVNNLLNTRNRQ
jgi:HPt (histidine-containing phosphotransfer) domain-containing protein